MIILGIESSCDDTAAALLDVRDDSQEILSSVVLGQADLHAEFGGVVPEIAARAHVSRLDFCVEQALTKAKRHISEVEGIAVTAGPGLIGGVVSGAMCAKGLAAALQIPIVAVNHLAGHALTPRLTDDLAFPFLLLLVSGGHCQFLAVRGPDEFERLGGTIDDAPGEAFDKTARILGLAQPGGPSIEKAAKDGDPTSVPLPKPLIDRPGFDMSFSGLKTAVLRARDARMVDGKISSADVADIAASFQATVAAVLTEKSRRTVEHLKQIGEPLSGFAVAGGVAANQEIRTELQALCQSYGLRFVAPPLSLCTDNAAMIAFAGAHELRTGHSDGMSFASRPRWPLDNNQPAMLGSGKKGAKA